MQTTEDRIGELVRLVGTKKDAARIAGVSTDQLNRYLSGQSKPALAPIAKLAEAAKISLDWLWTGRGPMRQEPRQLQGSIMPSPQFVEPASGKSFPIKEPHQRPPLSELTDDPVLYEEIRRLMESEARQQDVSFGPDDQIMILMTLYRLSLELGRPVGLGVVRNLVKLAGHPTEEAEKPKGTHPDPGHAHT